MNKKSILGIPILIGVIALIAWAFWPTGTDAGSKFTAKVQPLEAVNVDSVKVVNLYVDFSGSMRGYVDFAGVESGKNTFISTVSSMLDNIESEYKLVSVSKCGDRKYSKDPLRLAMQNKKIYNQQTTSIQSMIAEAKAKAGTNSLSIVVSDMVMSFGKRKLIESQDMFYNKTQIDGLGAAIHSEMKAIKNNGLDVMMVQYLSDYNGRYYCNYTENLKEPERYKNKKMENRPFYIFFIGKASLLRDMLSKHVIKDFTNIYTSFDIEPCSKETTYQIVAKEENKSAKLWNIGDIQNPDGLGTIWTTDDLNDSQAAFTFTCADFIVPPYCYSKNTKLSVVSEPDVISTAVVNYPSFSIDVTLKPFNELESCNVELCVICNNNWAETSSTLDDINEENLEGKTWGLAKIVEKIDDAFYPQGRNYDQVVGIFNFKIQK